MTETREAKVRERFEKWARGRKLTTMPNGDVYAHVESQMAWEAWQAGREDGIEQAAEECEMLHAVHPRDSGREPNCAGLIRSLSSKKDSQ